MVMDIHQLLYGRVTLHKWTFISFSMDVQHDIRGRPRVSIWTYNMWPWTSTSYYMDVQHYIRGRLAVSIWTYKVRPWTSISIRTYNITSVEFISFYMDVQRLAVDVHQLIYGRAILHKWMFISFSMDAKHDIHGRPPVSLWTYKSGRGRPPVTIWTFNITSVDV